MNNIDTEAISPWLEILWDQKGSDLLLSGGSAPRIRVNGKLPAGRRCPDPVRRARLMPSSGPSSTLAGGDLRHGAGRRLCVLLVGQGPPPWERLHPAGETALALRMIPSRIPSFAELDLPPTAEWLAKLPRGFVLVTGPTGSGKSTTLASIIDRINETRACHILTIEDPVEYVHHHKLSAVSQREIGLDSPSFDRALRSALREDPDVLLIGEMRDIESIQIAFTMAETGHLVFATLHTNDAPQAIDRIIDVFPAWRQEQTRVQLAASLGAILAQRLVPKVGGGMVAAFEVLIATQPGPEPDSRRAVQPAPEHHDDQPEGRNAYPRDQPGRADPRRHHHLRGCAQRFCSPQGAGSCAGAGQRRTPELRRAWLSWWPGPALFDRSRCDAVCTRLARTQRQTQRCDLRP